MARGGTNGALELDSAALTNPLTSLEGSCGCITEWYKCGYTLALRTITPLQHSFRYSIDAAKRAAHPLSISSYTSSYTYYVARANSSSSVWRPARNPLHCSA